MSDPARHLPPYETGGRPAPGPLRDWLAAMKAHAPAAQPESRQPETRPRAEPPRPAEPAWAPRIVQGPAEASHAAEADDVSELMAENLMLKAKLRLESDRHGELQSLLAQEIRDLRSHVQAEMEALHEIRAERDQARTERDQARADGEALRGECDLWRARCEALAQPLFQKR